MYMGRGIQTLLKAYCAPADIDEEESSQREELVITASTTNMEREQRSIQ